MRPASASACEGGVDDPVPGLLDLGGVRAEHLRRALPPAGAWCTGSPHALNSEQGDRGEHDRGRRCLRWADAGFVERPCDRNLLRNDLGATAWMRPYSVREAPRSTHGIRDTARRFEALPRGTHKFRAQQQQRRRRDGG